MYVWDGWVCSRGCMYGMGGCIGEGVCMGWVGV